MEFTFTPRAIDLQDRLKQFMADAIYPNEHAYYRERQAYPERVPSMVEEVKSDAQARGLWNLFLPGSGSGAGLTNVEYASLAEILGRSHDLAPEATNCSSPDTGNAGILDEFGTPDQRATWLDPLLAGTIRSCFAMSEPDVASSDANNIALSIEKSPKSYVLNGRKWFISGALDPRCSFAIVMGVSDPEGPRHKRHSMVVVPLGTPGLVIERDLPVFGFHGRGGHGQLVFDDVSVPHGNLLGNENEGFAIAQQRLGPGRIHSCMRLIGMAERALELMCLRAGERFVHGRPLSENDVIREWIARSRILLEQSRLLIYRAAWVMDTEDAKAAHVDISAIKVAATEMASYVVDKAIQVHGAAGLSGDFPLTHMFTEIRATRIGDGPDEVHLASVARAELRRQVVVAS